MKKYEYIALTKMFFFNCPTKSWILRQSIKYNEFPEDHFDKHWEKKYLENIDNVLGYFLKDNINEKLVTNLIESWSKTFYWSQSDAFNKLNGLEDLKQGEFKGGTIYFDLDNVLSVLGKNGFQLVNVLQPIIIYHKEEVVVKEEIIESDADGKKYLYRDRRYGGLEFDGKRYDYDHRTTMIFMREIDS